MTSLTSPQLSPSFLGPDAQVCGEEPFHIDPQAFFAGACRVGAYTYFGRGSLIGSLKSIGRFCSVAPNVTIGLGEHPTDYVSTHPAFFSAASMFSSLNERFGIPRTQEVLSTAPVIGHD